jgi:hypothetical protein
MRKILVVLAVVLMSVPVFGSQKKRAKAKLVKPAAAAVAAAEPVAVEPARHRRTPSMVVNGETSASAEISGQGVVLSEHPYAPPERKASAPRKSYSVDTQSGGGSQSEDEAPRSGSHVHGSRVPIQRPVVNRPVVQRPVVNRPRH